MSMDAISAKCYRLNVWKGFLKLLSLYAQHIFPILKATNLKPFKYILLGELI